MNNSHTCYAAAEVKAPKGVANRRLKGIQVWKKGWDKNPNAFVIAVLPDKASDEGNDKASPSKAVLASTTALFVLEPLADRVTRIIQLQQTDLNLGGAIGDMISNFAAKYALSILGELHTKYQRKGSVVDAEMREAFISKIPDALSIKDEFLDLVEDCKNLAFEYDSAEGMVETKFKKPSHSGEMAMKRNQKRGWCERAIATGRCTDIVDVCPETVLAWFFDYCSRERMRTHREEGHPARFTASNDGRHQCFATVKSVPWPLYNREEVTQIIWWENEDNLGTFFIAVASVDNVIIDYGRNMNSVKCFTRCLVQLEPSGKTGEDGRRNQCRMSVTQIFDAGGQIPSSVLNSLIPAQLSVVEEVRSAFSRDDQLDEEDRAALIGIMRNPRDELYDDDENDAIELVKNKFSSIGELAPLESTSQHVTVKGGHSKGDPLTVGFGEVLVDCSIETCCANEFMSFSRSALKEFYDGGNILREFFHYNSHCFRYKTVYAMPLGFKPREFLWRAVWKTINPNTMVMVYVPTLVGVSCRKEHIRAEGLVFIIFERVLTNGFEQTKMTCKTQANMHGNIPAKIVNSQLASRLMFLEDVRLKFDKSLEIDARNRESFITSIQGYDGAYTEDEKDQIKASLASLEGFDNLSEKTKVATVSPLASSTIGRNPKASSIAWGKSEIVVRASLEQVLAFLWHIDCRARQKKIGFREDYR